MTSSRFFDASVSSAKPIAAEAYAAELQKGVTHSSRDTAPRIQTLSEGIPQDHLFKAKKGQATLMVMHPRRILVDMLHSERAAIIRQSDLHEQHKEIVLRDIALDAKYSDRFAESVGGSFFPRIQSNTATILRGTDYLPPWATKRRRAAYLRKMDRFYSYFCRTDDALGDLLSPDVSKATLEERIIWQVGQIAGTKMLFSRESFCDGMEHVAAGEGLQVKGWIGWRRGRQLRKEAGSLLERTLIGGNLEKARQEPLDASELAFPRQIILSLAEDHEGWPVVLRHFSRTRKEQVLRDIFAEQMDVALKIKNELMPRLPYFE